MPRFVDLRELESCLSHSEAKEIALDEPVSVELMHRLASEGRLQYFPHFPRPYFRIDHPTAWLIQGIIGTPRLRIQLFGDRRAAALERLRELIETPAPSDETTKESPCHT
ncbi:MAG: hypothetical protein MUF10_16220 [Thermoanaerobaculaceae bacterium]|jgi:hypothetical protein|nr:hypothetical protein [Thermoanaerobaculaceae bacterium]